jgi:hypothetical protein
MRQRRPRFSVVLPSNAGTERLVGPSKSMAYSDASERPSTGGAEQQAQPPFAIAADGASAARHATSHRPLTAAPIPPIGRAGVHPLPPGHASDRTALHALPKAIPGRGTGDDTAAAQVERLLRRHLEELRFSFGEEPLTDLEGFCIAEDGCRAIIVAADLAPIARIFLYLHYLGHLALGHVRDERLSVTHEFRDRWRLPPHQKLRESASDAWALDLLNAHTPRSTSSALHPSPFANGILGELRNLRLAAGYLRACHLRLQATLAMHPHLVPALQQHAATRRLPASARPAPLRRFRHTGPRALRPPTAPTPIAARRATP